jgi:DNA-binding NtrC family response regulator
VRELIAVMERAVILGSGERLEVAKALGVAPAPAAPASSGAGEPAGAADAAFLPLDRAMARHIEAALARTAGRVEGPRGAAALLGINPHTLRARMRKLGVDVRRYRTA